MPFTSESAAEAGRAGGVASGATRRAKRQLRADVRVRQAIQAKADDLAGVLINAALGQGPFDALDPKDRATFALRALELGVGRPRQLPEAPQEDAEGRTEPQEGIAFGVRDGE